MKFFNQPLASMKGIVPVIFFLVLGCNLCAQDTASTKSNSQFISRNKAYMISIDMEQWNVDTTGAWQLEFKEKYGMLSGYFTELGAFVSEGMMKKLLQDEFKSLGEIKKVKVYKKTLKNLTVDYFEFQLKYNGYNYKYQGFFYTDDRSGTMQIVVGGEEQAAFRLQGLIEGLFNGVKMNR
jgi:hypothetical protein